MKLAEAVSIATEALQNQSDSPVSLSKSVGVAINQVAGCRQPPDKPAPPSEELSFESLFRWVTEPNVAEEIPA